MNIDKIKKVVDSCTTIEQMDVAYQYICCAQQCEQQRLANLIKYGSASHETVQEIVDSHARRLICLEIRKALCGRQSYLKLVESGWGSVEVTK